ncbi:hypothetical protein [Streptantibioticus silvisoli]|uniref:Lysyl-tRNA synthetase N-terminal transmembrane region domain-containing protein n=1 Tax=Streptantibioticus silvisoli TaxID=2705255 RepID=A0ABT6W5Q8_9ACTN|nr:hypothetical protein [Streptantibioticus silvisoli]MDI5966086.1 hypothetical protein [Streptantibioticus silvisoli]
MSGGRRTDGGSGGRTARHGPLGAAWRRAADRVPVWLGGFFGLLGAVCALSALIAPLRHAIAPALRFVGAWLVPASPNLAHAVFLLLLSAAMLARKRAAWWVVTFYVALVLLAEALTVTMVGVTRSAVSLAVTAAVPAVLVAGRGHFPARVRRGAFWRALGVLVAGPAVGVAAGWALVAAFHDGLPARQWLLWSANRVLGGLTSTRRFGGRPPQAIDFPLGLFGALALLNAARALFRSQRARAALGAGDEARLRALLARHGAQDSLGYFATRRDKAVVFAPEARASAWTASSCSSPACRSARRCPSRWSAASESRRGATGFGGTARMSRATAS